MMKKFSKKIWALVFAGMMAVSCVGCGSQGDTSSTAGSAAVGSAASGSAAEGTAGGASDTASAETGYKDEMHIALATEPTNLDIVVNTATVSTEIAYGTIFEALVSMDENYQPVAELAESWDVSEDSTEYTWYLRQGILFHNGQEMTAEDAAASMNRWLANAGNAQSMIGDAEFVAEDTYTLKLKMDHACAYVNELIAGLGQRAAIMPKSVIDAIDETGIVSEYIGTGPYKFVDWAEHQQIHITRNDDYQPYGEEGVFSGWAGYKSAYTKDIYFEIVTDASTITAGMQSGEYDATTGITADNIYLFEDDSSYIVEGQECEMAFLIFNKKEGLGADPAIRRAVQAAIDSEEVMLGTYGSEEMYSLYSSYAFSNIADWYTEAGSEYYNQGDPEKAAQLLADAGYTTDKPFRILVASDDAGFYSMAVIMQNQLQEAGMNVEILSYDWATFVSVRNDQPENYDAFITSFSPKILPTMNLYLSDTWAGWVNDERILGDLTSINTDTSKESAVEKWVALQEYMYEESVPVVKLGSSMTFMVGSSKLEGVRFFEHIVYSNCKVQE